MTTDHIRDQLADVIASGLRMRQPPATIADRQAATVRDLIADHLEQAADATDGCVGPRSTAAMLRSRATALRNQNR